MFGMFFGGSGNNPFSMNMGNRFNTTRVSQNGNGVSFQTFGSGGIHGMNMPRRTINRYGIIIINNR